MPITGLHHVSLIIADIPTAVAFYREVLELQPLERPELNFPGYWFSMGDRQLHLLALPNPDPVQGRPQHVGRDRHLALLVDDIGPFIERLEQRDITYTRSRSGRAAVFFRDPDGNGIELMEG